MVTAKLIRTQMFCEHSRVAKTNSRLVARGVDQAEGVDTCETFDTKPSLSCVRLLTAEVCE